MDKFNSYLDGLMAIKKILSENSVLKVDLENDGDVTIVVTSWSGPRSRIDILAEVDTLVAKFTAESVISNIFTVERDCNCIRIWLTSSERED